MKKLFLITVLLSFAFVANSCSDDDNKLSYPDCLNNMIDDIMQGTPSNPRVSIDKYSYNGQIVYLVNNYYAAYVNNVVNESCEHICSIGGAIGLGCPDWSSAQFIETIWTDPR